MENECSYDARQRFHLTALADIVRELALDAGRRDLADKATSLMELIYEGMR